MPYGKRSSIERVQAAMTTLELRCKTLGLMDKDYGKAIVRIKVNGFGADLTKLKLKPAKDASWQEEAVAQALKAFRRAQAQVNSPDCDGDTYESEDVTKLEQAVQMLC